MSIQLFNVNNEEYFGDNVYLIHRPYILGNPYTHIKDKQTKAMFIVPTREEAIERYSHYFDTMYGKNIKFTKVIDEIYEKYRQGEHILLGCYCEVGKHETKHCHGEVIIEKLQRRLLKENFATIKKMRENLLNSK